MMEAVNVGEIRPSFVATSLERTIFPSEGFFTVAKVPKMLSDGLEKSRYPPPPPLLRR